MRDLYGAELLQRLLEVTGVPRAKIRISGLIGQAGVSRQTRASNSCL